MPLKNSNTETPAIGSKSLILRSRDQLELELELKSELESSTQRHLEEWLLDSDDVSFIKWLMLSVANALLCSAIDSDPETSPSFLLADTSSKWCLASFRSAAAQRQTKLVSPYITHNIT